MTEKTSQCQDPLWDEAWNWVLCQHETGFDDAAFNAQLNQWLQANPAHRKAYDQAARIWKVAALKAVGVGVPDHLHSISIELKPGPDVGVCTAVDAWTGLRVRALEAPDGYLAAVAWLNKEESL